MLEAAGNYPRTDREVFDASGSHRLDECGDACDVMRILGANPGSS